LDVTGPDLWQRTTSSEALQLAWHKVKSNGGSAGGDGVSLNEFERDLFANLTQLRSEILAGTYRTGPFRRLTVPKKKPGYRILTVPGIRDRILHTSISASLTPIMEPMFEDGSFAYRPGRGVTHAVERIEKWRKRGFSVVIEADIVSYFDNIDQEILKGKLRSILAPLPGAEALLALVDRLLDDQGKALGTPGCGLVQGSPLSPLLANLYLDALDEEIESQGVKIVRFADDFVILCKSEQKAEKVLKHCVKVLLEHNLRLHEDGTRIVSFEKGFDFIGYLFLRTLALKEKPQNTGRGSRKAIKSEVTDEGIIQLDDQGSRFDPGKRVLYVLDPSHRLTVRNRSFSVIRVEDAELIAIPHRRLGRIEIGPGVDFSRNILDLALQSEIDISMVDGYGQTRGIVQTYGGKRATTQLAQARAVLDDTQRKAFSILLVSARIRNQRTQLMRLDRNRHLPEVAKALETLKRGLRKTAIATTIEELRGIEGSGGAAYWPALGSLLETQNEEAVFRRSRPARDPVNAAVNYLTAVLERDVRAAIQQANLHPGFAFLHASRDRHDGLIYDLMEPFRANLTEGLVVYLFNARRLKHEMFDTRNQDACEISDEGKKALISAYETAVARRVNRPDGQGKLAWRPMMKFQAQTLAKAVIAQNSSLFTPYLMEP
jgi:CRISPR-associated protein Cas1